MPHHPGEIFVLEKEGVVAVRRAHLQVGAVEPVALQRVHDLLGLVRRIQPVAAEGDDEEAHVVGQLPEHLHQHAAPGRQVEVVERLGDVEVGVGVEAAREHLALVAQVALHLEVQAAARGPATSVSRMRRPNFSCMASSDR